MRQMHLFAPGALFLRQMDSMRAARTKLRGAQSINPMFIVNLTIVLSLTKEGSINSLVGVSLSKLMYHYVSRGVPKSCRIC